MKIKDGCVKINFTLKGMICHEWRSVSSTHSLVNGSSLALHPTCPPHRMSVAVIKYPDKIKAEGEGSIFTHSF